MILGADFMSQCSVRSAAGFEFRAVDQSQLSPRLLELHAAETQLFPFMGPSPMKQVIQSAEPLPRRALQVLRVDEAQLSPSPWHLKLPIQEHDVLWWEVLSPRKVRLAPGSDSVYYVAYERGGRKDTLVSIYKAERKASRFSVAVREGVDVDPDALKPVREALLVAVDEQAGDAILVYLRARPSPPQHGAGAHKLVLQHVDLSVASGGGVFQTNAIPVGGVVAAQAWRDSHFCLNELLFVDGQLLLVAVVKAMGEDSALYKLEASKTKGLLVKFVDSLNHGFRLPFLMPLTYEGKCVMGPEFNVGRAMTSMSLPSVLEPAVLSAASVAACTIFRGDSIQTRAPPSGTWWHGQPALDKIVGRQHEEPTLQPLGEWREWLLVWCLDVDARTLMVYAIRGWNVANPHVVVVRKLNAWQSVPEWVKARGIGAGVPLPITTLSLRAGHLLMQVHIKSAGSTQPHVYLARINLHEWLPKAPLCFGCRVTEPLTAPSTPLVCSTCKEKGFNRYSWLFGCRYCCKQCQVADFKAHKQLHTFPPLDDWSRADWDEWQRVMQPNF